MDVLNDLDGNYKGSFVRQKLSMRSGETDKAISVIDQRFTEIGKTIGSELKHIGNLDCDVLERDGELYVLELNPRFGGGYPFSHEAGMNTCKSYISWLKGQDTFDIDNQYEADVEFAKCDRLLKIK
jgi:carbamoyl-phosphate synthase large subunit